MQDLLYDYEIPMLRSLKIYIMRKGVNRIIEQMGKVESTN